MPLTSDEECRLRCVELATQAGPKRVVTRAKVIYNFVKAVDERKNNVIEKVPLNVTQEEMARRVVGTVRPT